MMRLVAYVSLCLVAVASRAFADETVPRNLTVYKRYILGPGDKLKLSVFGEKDFDSNPTVDVSGNIAVPLLGPVRAAGTSIEDLDEKIERALVDQQYFLTPIVTIALVEARPFWINGDVAKPGAYPYEANITVKRATIAAGGAAASSKMSLIGGVKSTTTVNLVPIVTIIRIVDGRKEIINADEESKVYPGDVVNVLYSLAWLTKPIR